MEFQGFCPVPAITAAVEGIQCWRAPWPALSPNQQIGISLIDPDRHDLGFGNRIDAAKVWLDYSQALWCAPFFGSQDESISGAGPFVFLTMRL